MARPSVLPQTPQDQIIVSDEEEEGEEMEEEDVNAGAEIGPPNSSFFGQARDQIASALGIMSASVETARKSLPDVRKDNALTADMGQEQSHALNEALHATAQQVTRDGNKRKSSGKLSSVRPASKANPQYIPQRPNQRKLVGKANTRRDPYEIADDDSPQKSLPRNHGGLQQPRPISPRKKDRVKGGASGISTVAAQSKGASRLIDENIDAAGLPQPAANAVEQQEADAVDATATKDDHIDATSDKPAKKKLGRPPKGKHKPPVPRHSKVVDTSTAPAANEAAGDDLVDEADRVRAGSDTEQSGMPGTAAKRKSPRKSKPPKRLGQEAEHDDDFLPSRAKPPARDKAQLADLGDPTVGGALESSPVKKRNDSEAVSRKRKAGPTGDRPAKRTTTDTLFVNASEEDGSVADSDDSEEQSEEDAEVNESHIFGQWATLRHVYHESRKINETADLELEDEQVKTLVDLCDTARKRYARLRDQDGSLGPATEDDDPAPILMEISDRVDDLRGVNEDYMPDFKNSKKIQNIYSHLLPKLVKLIWSAAECYVIIDKNEVPMGQLTMGHVNMLRKAMHMVLRMIDSAAKKYTRPEPSLRLVTIVRREIRPELYKVWDTLRRISQSNADRLEQVARQDRQARREEYMAKAKKEQDRVRRDEIQEQEAAVRAAELHREEAEERREAWITEQKQKWRTLHNERKWAEPGWIRPAKMKHLDFNDPSEEDANGRPISRTDSLAPRVRPSPGIVQQAASVSWEMHELTALHDGLQAYAGPRVYEKIFRRYCGIGKELNRFNVTEIVTTAEMIRQRLTAPQDANAGKGWEVEDWMMAIPTIWTKVQTAYGKENVDSLIDLTAED